MNGTWYVRYSSLGYGGGFDAFQWGLPGDLPISADFDGDGKIELTIFRPSNGTWHVRYSSLGCSNGSAVPSRGAVLFSCALPPAWSRVIRGQVHLKTPMI